MRTKARAVFGALAAAWLAGCLGVETYRERAPAQSLEIRLVAREGAEADVLPRASGGGELALERGVVVRASHVRHVRLLDAADGARVLVLDLDDVGRARLAEASGSNVGRRLAIVAGGRVIAAPTIRNALTEGEAYVAVPEAELERAFAAMSEGE